jgi:hypothetical protein
MAHAIVQRTAFQSLFMVAPFPLTRGYRKNHDCRKRNNRRNQDYAEDFSCLRFGELFLRSLCHGVRFHGQQQLGNDAELAEFVGGK